MAALDLVDMQPGVDNTCHQLSQLLEGGDLACTSPSILLLVHLQVSPCLRAAVCSLLLSCSHSLAVPFSTYKTGFWGPSERP